MTHACTLAMFANEQEMSIDVAKCRRVILDTHRNLVMEELDVFVGLVKNRCGIGLKCEDANDKLGHYRSQKSLVPRALGSLR